ncbi:LysR family transcriptional regulator [Roseixanthobacter liquoris]|uniref:LysR family transcriptional regulator n=1 Tax=Roseixanthobacter liquoris TaxID=3119921 RepID=UPI003729C616
MKDEARVRSQFDTSRFMSSVTLRQIRYFVAAAECGKVSLAASMIAISPSAITDAIGELEEMAGTQLFKRHPRGLALTYEGHRFLVHCRNILSAIKDASYAFSHPDNSVEGAFTLATTSTVLGYFIVPLVTRFQRSFPNIVVHLVEGKRRDIEDGLLKDDCDLAVVLVSNSENRPGLRSYTLIQSVRRLWLSPRHPLLNREAISLADVANEPYIQLTIDEADVSTSSYWKANEQEPRIVLRTESVEAMRSLIAFGHGVTILSDMMYRPWSLEGDRVEVRDLTDKIPTMDTGLLWKGDQVRNRAAMTFQNFCRLEYEKDLLSRARTVNQA